MLVGERPASYLVRSIWASNLFNFASHESVYCLFPRATMERKFIFVLGLPSSSAFEVLDTFKDRGYRPGDLGWRRQAPEFVRNRYVGDGFTCRLRFTRGVGGIPTSLQNVRFKVLSS